MYILHVTYDVKEGMREEFLQKLQELQVAQKSREEEGNIDYTYYLPADGSNQVFLVEVWESVAAQEAHTHTEHFYALAGIKNTYVDKTELVRFDGAKNLA